jgi:hypothetical protein
LVMWQVQAPLAGWAVASILWEPGLHLLLQRDRGLAGRCRWVDRLHGGPGVGLHPGQGRGRRGDAHGLRPWRRRRAAERPRVAPAERTAHVAAPMAAVSIVPPTVPAPFGRAGA